MLTFSDQLGRIITLSGYPRRILSVVPSQTELLSDLQLDDEVIGITKFCVRPDNWFRSKARIGGTKDLNLSRIEGLKPDIIFANKEENVKEQIDAIAEKFPVWISDVSDLESAIDMILSISDICERPGQGRFMVGQIRAGFQDLQNEIQPAKPIRTCYLIWKDPYMTVGGDTFIHSMLAACGFDNIFTDRNRYPQISIDDIRKLDCEILLLSSEPYPFRDRHAQELLRNLPNTKILLVDGQVFSWYGSRLVYAPSYFKHLMAVLNNDDTKMNNITVNVD